MEGSLLLRLLSTTTPPVISETIWLAVLLVVQQVTFSCMAWACAFLCSDTYRRGSDLPVIFTVAASKGKPRQPPTLALPCVVLVVTIVTGEEQYSSLWVYHSDPVTGSCTFAYRWDVCHCFKLPPGKSLMIHFGT